MVIFSHIDGFMKEPLDLVDDHIDMFIQTGRRRWDFGCFIFYRDPIYDIEGSSQAKGVEVSSSEDWSSCMYDSDVWHPDDDMITDLFCPFEDDPTQHFQDDFQPSLGSCDADPFGDADLFYEDFQPPSSSILDRTLGHGHPRAIQGPHYQTKYFHIEILVGICR
jgi:hypothetical protein